MAVSLGKMPTTSVRRLISLFSRSKGLIDQILRQCPIGKAVKAVTSAASRATLHGTALQSGDNYDYFEWAIRRRHATAAARAIDDFGFISRRLHAGDRLSVTLERCRTFRNAFSKASTQVLSNRLTRSDWWEPSELQAIQATLTD